MSFFMDVMVISLQIYAKLFNFAPVKDRKLLNRELGRISAEEYRTSRPASGVVLVLDNVRSAHNVGSAFRTSDAFGVDKVYLCGICAVPPSAEIHKTALGAEDAVPWRHFASTLEAVESLKAEGYTVVAVEQTENSAKLAAAGVAPTAAASTQYAFIFGNEVEGVGQEVVDACDFSLEIPQHGTKHSLNVSVTVGIVLFAFSACPSVISN